MLKVFDLVQDKESVVENAKKVGLDLIDGDKIYHLKKAKAKVPSENGYPDSYSVIIGKPQLIGIKDKVWLYFTGRGEFNWFKTSPVVSCKETEDNFEIETENSLYILEKM